MNRIQNKYHKKGTHEIKKESFYHTLITKYTSKTMDIMN